MGIFKTRDCKWKDHLTYTIPVNISQILILRKSHNYTNLGSTKNSADKLGPMAFISLLGDPANLTKQNFEHNVS